MEEKHVNALYKDGKKKIELNIATFSWQEDSVFYVYCPALDLTGYGSTSEEAKKSFDYILEEFVVYTHNKKTIFKELEKLGWAVNKHKMKVVAPDFEELLTDNEHFNNLYKSKSLIKDSSSINFALA
jgi:hypothetical protein